MKQSMYVLVGIIGILFSSAAAQESFVVSGRVVWNSVGIAGAVVRSLATGVSDTTDSLGYFHLASSAALAVRRPLASVRSSWASSGMRWTLDGRVVRNVPGTGLGIARGLRLAAPEQFEAVASGFVAQVQSLDPAASSSLFSLQKNSTWKAKRHMWVWGSAVAETDAARDSLFTFAATHGIGTFYLDCGDLMGSQRPQLEAFIAAAAERFYEVELLFGQPEWALTANHGEPVAIGTQAAQLVTDLAATNQPLPVGLQFDVEPYTLNEWDVDMVGVANQLVDMYAEVDSVLVAGLPASSDFRLIACIPRWFDGRAVLRNSLTRPLSEWLADATDRLTLMDYVDKAPSIINDAADEIAYAGVTGKQVVIGVETIVGLDPPTVTFAEEGRDSMEVALGQVFAVYRDSAAFQGIAIHHYGSYRSW